MSLTGLNPDYKLQTARLDGAGKLKVTTAAYSATEQRPVWNTIRPVSCMDYNGCDARSFRSYYKMPKSGWYAVRAEFRTDYAGGATSITAVAFAGTRSLATDNPVAADGSAGTWQVAAGAPFTLTAASATYSTDGKFGRGLSTWCLVYAPPATDRTGAGYVIVDARPSGTNTRCIVAVESAEFETVSAGLLGTAYKTCYASATTDWTTANQNNFTRNAASFQNQYHVCAGLDFIPLDGSMIFGLAMYGDSIIDGFDKGLGNTAVMAYGYSFSAVAIGLLNAEGRPATLMNNGSAGKDSPFFAGRLAEDLLDPDFRPTAVGVEGFSSNGLFTAASVDAGWAASKAQIQAAIARGSKAFALTVPPSGANNTPAQVAQRVRGNQMIRASGLPYFDLAAYFSDGSTTAIPAPPTALCYDTVHPNRTGSDSIGPRFATFLKTL